MHRFWNPKVQEHIFIWKSEKARGAYCFKGARQAAINVAEGRKQATILASEADKAEQINKASGEAEAILLRAQASAQGIEKVALAISRDRGTDAVSMTVAEKYVDAFGKMAKEGTTMIVPASANDAASMVAQVKLICALKKFSADFCVVLEQ